MMGQPGSGYRMIPTGARTCRRQTQKKVQPSPRRQRVQRHVHGGAIAAGPAMARDPGSATSCPRSRAGATASAGLSAAAF
jgi:hypothetical protein